MDFIDGVRGGFFMDNWQFLTAVIGGIVTTCTLATYFWNASRLFATKEYTDEEDEEIRKRIDILDARCEKFVTEKWAVDQISRIHSRIDDQNVKSDRIDNSIRTMERSHSEVATALKYMGDSITALTNKLDMIISSNTAPQCQIPGHHQQPPRMPSDSAVEYLREKLGVVKSHDDNP